VTRPETHPAKAARELLVQLLDAAPSKGHKPRALARAV
jgi:hypothetical protein